MASRRIGLVFLCSLIFVASGCENSPISALNAYKISDDDGAPSDTPLTPVKVVNYSFDAAGSYYFPDKTSVRKIAANGTVTAVAGGGTPGFCGNGMSADKADLSGGAVLQTSAGDLIVADREHFVLRKIDHSTGLISNYAGIGTDGVTGDGGLATSAEIQFGLFLDIDSSDNVYLGTASGTRVRKITASTGNISTIINDGTLVRISGIAVDSAANVYVADGALHQIFVYTAASNYVTRNTLVGTGTPGYSADNAVGTSMDISYPASLTISPAGHLYYAEIGSNIIRRVNVSTSAVTTVVGAYLGNHTMTMCQDLLGANAADGLLATSTELNQPGAIRVDVAGNIYFNELGRSTFRKVDAGTGLVSTIAGIPGNPTQGTGNGGLATSAKLTFASTDLPFNNGELLCSPFSTQVGSAFVLTSGGDVIYAEVSGQLRKIDGTTHIISSISGTFANCGNGGLATNAVLTNVGAVALDKAGDIYFFDRAGASVRKVDHTTGIISNFLGTGVEGPSGNNSPKATFRLSPDTSRLIFDENNNLYLSEGTLIRRLNASTGKVKILAGNGTRNSIGENVPATTEGIDVLDFTLDRYGMIYVADGSRVRKVDSQTGRIATIAGSLVAGSDGDGGVGSDALFKTLSSIALDPNGNLILLDSQAAQIRKIAPSSTGFAGGLVSTIAGTGVSDSNGDGGLATAAEVIASRNLSVNSAADIYFYGGNRIRKVTTSTGIISTVIGNGTVGHSGNGGAATSALIDP